MGKKGGLNCFQTVGFEMSCTKTDEMSQMTISLAIYRDDNKTAGKHRGETEKIRKANIFSQKFVLE